MKRVSQSRLSFGTSSLSVVSVKKPRLSSSCKSISGSNFGPCPLCQTSFPLHKLQSHAATCTGEAPKKEEFLKPTSEPVPGLYVFENLLTEDEEKEILTALESESSHPWHLTHFNGPSFGKRWGVHCNLRDRCVTTAERPMPDFFFRILKPKLDKVRALKAIRINEANAIDYRRKQGHHLDAHCDDRQLCLEPIGNLSLAGDCYMTYKNVKGNNKEYKVLLKARTLQVLTGKSRYEYSHGIDNEDLLTDRRVSFTMRESPLTKL